MSKKQKNLNIVFKISSKLTNITYEISKKKSIISCKIILINLFNLLFFVIFRLKTFAITQISKFVPSRKLLVNL